MAYVVQCVQICHKSEDLSNPGMEPGAGFWWEAQVLGVVYGGDWCFY